MKLYSGRERLHTLNVCWLICTDLLFWNNRCVIKNGWISQGNKICKASSNPNFIVSLRFTSTCSLFVEYNIHMKSLASDTDVEVFSEVIHHSRCHIWWNRRHFFSNRCLQLVHPTTPCYQLKLPSPADPTVGPPLYSSPNRSVTLAWNTSILSDTLCTLNSYLNSWLFILLYHCWSRDTDLGKIWDFCSDMFCICACACMCLGVCACGIVMWACTCVFKIKWQLRTLDCSN
jgi:hypothetical protein